MAPYLKSSNHVASMDLLRGIAAVSVMLFHLLGSCSFSSLPILKDVVSHMYLGLDLFFVLSGFIIPYSLHQAGYTLRSFPRFMLRRSCRIEIPYVASFVLVIIMRMVHDSFYGNLYIPDWEQVLLHLAYLNRYFGKDPFIVVYWTLALEFQYYILIGLAFGFLMRPGRVLPLLLLLAWCLICWIERFPREWFLFQYGYHFLAGILLFMYSARRLSKAILAALIASALVLMGMKNGWHVSLTVLAGVLVLLFLRSSWRIPDFFGRISYSLYLTHTEAGGWLEVYIREFFTSETMLKLVVVVFAIAFATVFHAVIERPAVRLSRRIAYGKHHGDHTAVSNGPP